ncbi:anoctamin-10 isoform X1 [Hydra vulgaris]|uniref:anoctamin-10 isoform X1 n=1 Tax=Hydra vulgaris TaxID=6087 RepID=UPI0002B49272|nr:anoctamin-10 [Hydra vulgaris]
MEGDFNSPTYLIKIAETCPEKSLSYLKDSLISSNLTVIDEKISGNRILSVQCSFSNLCIQAENLELLKDVNSPEKVREFNQKDLLSFKFDSKQTFFTSAEQLFLLENILHNVKFSKDEFLRNGLKSFGASDSILTGCLHSNPCIIESYTPMHQQDELKKLWGKVLKNPFIIPVNDLRDYYGEDVAYYFAWMSFLTWSLIPIAVIGILIFLHQPNESADDSHYLPFYALGMALWTIIYTKLWKRNENVLALLWKTTDVEKVDMIRPEFFGVTRPSPITGINEKYFPAWKRRFRYLLSFLISIPFLLLGIGAMIISLNLNGYISDDNSPIHIHELGHYADPGNIFANDNKYYGWLIPTIAHSIVINILNKLYRTVASYCTDFENHKTEQQHNDSLIAKRLLFELFDCYLPLFYIAFYQLDIVSLKRELIGLFWGDEIRRLVTESIIPYVLEKITARRRLAKSALIKKNEDIKFNDSEILENLELDEYEPFDDYIEMVTQYGYVTLFASAFPLCSIITVLFLFIEARSDMFKIMFLCRRPHVRRARNIGVWYKVLTLMTLVSMLTNCFLFGFASEQLAEWVPDMYETRDDGDRWIKLGSGRYIVGLVFVAEHILILCLVLSHYLISDVPIAVKNELARREYVKKQEFKSLKERKKSLE